MLIWQQILYLCLVSFSHYRAWVLWRSWKSWDDRIDRNTFRFLWEFVNKKYSVKFFFNLGRPQEIFNKRIMILVLYESCVTKMRKNNSRKTWNALNFVLKLYFTFFLDKCFYMYWNYCIIESVKFMPPLIEKVRKWYTCISKLEKKEKILNRQRAIRHKAEMFGNFCCLIFQKWF